MLKIPISALRANDACVTVCNRLEQLLPDGIVPVSRDWAAFCTTHHIPVEWAFAWLPEAELLALMKKWLLDVTAGFNPTWLDDVLRAMETRDPELVARLVSVLHHERNAGDVPSRVAAGSAFACMFGIQKSLAGEDVVPAAIDALTYRGQYRANAGVATAREQPAARQVAYADILALCERSEVPEEFRRSVAGSG